mgnify:FL=1|tara:strand:- start:1471 stop:2568 length:1098 start_codon:yes stop_codon:yes gene_type:complete
MKYITQHPIKKSDLGFHGNLFGGKLLAWLDAAAASYASEFCDTPRMVTKSIDKCVFNKPAKEGQLLKIYGNVQKIGNTSLNLYMEARSHNVYNGKQNVILATNITFVRVDEMGDAIPISDRVKDKLIEKKLDLVISTSRRFHLLEKTINSFTDLNPNIGKYIGKIHIIDDRSKDRSKILSLIQNSFPNNVVELIKFNSNDEFSYVDKFNYIKSVNNKYCLLLEEDWESIEKIDLEKHLKFLDKNEEIDQIILSGHYWLQDKDVKEATHIDKEYWDHNKSEKFKHVTGYERDIDGKIIYKWFVGNPSFTLNPTINRVSLFQRGEFKKIRYYEEDFGKQVNAKQVITKNAKFVHIGDLESAEGTTWN